MVWFSLLLAFNLVGFVAILTIVAGWRLSVSFYALSALSLLYLGSATLVFHLVRYSIARVLRRPVLLWFGARIRRSLVRCAALLVLSTYLLIVGAYTMDVGLSTVTILPRVPGQIAPITLKFRGAVHVAIATGAMGLVCSSLLLVRQFRRYRRWRSICLRYESRPRL